MVKRYKAERESENADEEALFARAMADVQPLRREDRVVVAARRPAGTRRQPVAAAKEPGFDLELDGEHLAGVAADADPAVLSWLQRDELAPEARVDLHGLDSEQARAAVRRAVAQAQRAGQRCVLIIHGRGLRSPDGPVLKQALPTWLTEPPLAQQVLAFTSAGAGHGRTGATLVLLRRKQPPARGAERKRKR